MKAGVCRFCGCSEFDACVVDDGLSLVGCHWIDPARTVCSACQPAAAAERHALTVHPDLEASPAQRLAYHQGFVVGWFGVRGHLKRNPYAARRGTLARGRRGRLAELWRKGQLAGEAAGHQQRLTCGHLENAPRRHVFQRRATRRRLSA